MNALTSNSLCCCDDEIEVQLRQLTHPCYPCCLRYSLDQQFLYKLVSEAVKGPGEMTNPLLGKRVDFTSPRT